MEKKAFDLITFGEIMLRLSPPRHARIVDGDIFEKRAGGAELNVASGVALMGLRTGIISRLPQNELGTFIKNRIRFVGVSDDYLTYDDDPRARLGIYYYEMEQQKRYVRNTERHIKYNREAKLMKKWKYVIVAIVGILFAVIYSFTKMGDHIQCTSSALP